MKPRFFKTKAEFAKWLERNHSTSDELLVGYHKKATGRPSLTWPESVDVALCFGWIDGIRRRIDDDSYSIRFTPRRARSIWSLRNIDRVKELTDSGEMRPEGLAAFRARADERSALYSHEQRQAAALDPAYEREFKRKRKAWAFFGSCPPSYRKAAIHWVMSAKREDTRRRRMGKLIEASASGEKVPPLA